MKQKAVARIGCTRNTGKKKKQKTKNWVFEFKKVKLVKPTQIIHIISVNMFQSGTCKMFMQNVEFTSFLQAD